ncbi:MAG: 4'-phosphopantetheinyl transferase superfamily protein [Chloroflexi bacterium]|nr:4'-phosphopantetheinyl transferase superfamily protein [Chloroflexota bacterium]
MTIDDAWPSPPASPALRGNDVHLWRADLNQPSRVLSQLAQTLSADEHQRAERFHFDVHRHHFIVGRGFLRTVLASYLGIEPDQVQFNYGPQGKPGLQNSGGFPGLQFNLAHSHELAVLAVTQDREIGVDVEYIRPVLDMEQVAARNFSPRENVILNSLPVSERQPAFFTCWTRKEAYIKAIGEGLSRPLDQFDVSLTPGEAANLLWVAGRPEEALRWSLCELDVGAGYVAALAVEGQDLSITKWQWQSFK